MERQLLLHRPRGKKGKGGSLFEHLQQAIQTPEQWPKEYLPIGPPEGFRHVWDIFWELRSHSKSGFSGPENISFADLDAWQRVRGERLGNNYVDMILAMDSAYMAEWARQESK